MARKKFVAQDIERGSGLVADQHEVRQRNRRKAQYEARGTSDVRVGERDSEVRDAKRRILNRLPQQEASTRRVMRQGIQKAFALYKDADKKAKKNGGELRVVEKSEVREGAKEIASQTVREMRDQILANIESSVKTYLIGIRRSLPDRSALPMSKINEIARRKAIEVYQRASGADGKTTPQRLAALGVRVEQELLAAYGHRDRERLNKRLVDPKGKNGACVTKGFMRMNRTEQNRAMHEATVEACRAIGVTFFYWRLSAAHKSYGGTEICEVLSEATGLDVTNVIPQGFTGSLSGLFTADSLPSIPHPNCMCSIEPLILL